MTIAGAFPVHRVRLLTCIVRGLSDSRSAPDRMDGPGPVTVLKCSSAQSGLQGQRTHCFFIERLALGKQALERLRIENGFERGE